MRKLFTLLALLACVVGGLKAETVTVASWNKGTINGGTWTAIGNAALNYTTKYNSNKTSVTCMTFPNSIGKNAHAIKLEGDFKAGDVITIQPFTQMSTADFTGGSKYATILLYDSSAKQIADLTGSKAGALTVTDGHEEAGEPKEFSYTLQDDYTELYFGRGGGTRINAMKIVVTREVVGGTEPVTTTVSPTSATILKGNTVTLTGSFTGGTFDGEWVSDNEAVATVSSAGVVTGVAIGTANITYQWKNDHSKPAYKASAAITVLNGFDKSNLTVVKTYDFANWGATTLTIGDKAGSIWNQANSRNYDVFYCTNEGLENLAVQGVLASNKGWSINANGLYEGSGAGRCAAIAGIKAGQFVEFYHNSATSFYTKNDKSDSGIRKLAAVEESGHHVYYALEDGMIGFEMDKGHYITSINIYEEKTGVPASLTFSATAATATLGEPFTAPTLTTDPTGLTGIVYSSSNTAVATVDAKTGAVTLTGAGTTTITATFEGNDDYWGASASYELTVVDPNASADVVVGYTEEIDGTTLKARQLTGADHITISAPIFGSNISDQKNTSRTVYIDNTAYANTNSWRKSQNGTYDGQNIGYKLTVEPGYKMNISHIAARVAIGDDTYKWYVEILNGAGTQVWKSGERTSKKADNPTATIDADVTDKADIQGLTGDVTVNLWVQQNGSTKYFSINYLQLTVTTSVDERATYAMSVSQNIAEAGTVTPTDGAEVAEGESVAFTATPADAYKFVKWVIDGQDQTANPYIIDNVDATHTAEAVFAKRFTVTYNLGEEKGTTTKVLNNVRRENGYDEKYAADDDTYTIPAYADKYLYKEGYVFDKWTDVTGKTYQSGDKLTLTADVVLTPVFKATTQTLEQSVVETVVTWTFAKADILFTDWQSNTQYGYYTQTVSVNGERIAVPMTITKGKVGNWGRSDAIAQTNPGTTFTIPAVSGMKIEIPNGYTDFSTTTIAGTTDYDGAGTKTIAYVYEGTDATIDIVVGESNQYLNRISVTYPATQLCVLITEAGWATAIAPVAADFTQASGIEAYTAKLTDGVVKLTRVDNVPAGTGIVLKGQAGLYIVPAAEASTTDQGDLKGSATEATPMDDDYTYYGLAINSEGNAQFKRLNAGGTIAAGKAYLVVKGTAGAREILTIGDAGATGIVEVMALRTNGQALYNLNGQRIGTLPRKGLYIQNGKKYVK